MPNPEVEAIAQAKHGLTVAELTQLELQYFRQRKNPATALILSLLLGSVGVDRFYLGDINLGIAKLLTGGGLLIWYLADLFLITGATHKKNAAALRDIRATIIAVRPG